MTEEANRNTVLSDEKSENNIYEKRPEKEEYKISQTNMKRFLPPLQKKNQGIDEIEVRRGFAKARSFPLFFRRMFLASENKACEFFVRQGFICTDDASEAIQNLGMNPDSFVYVRFCGNVYPVGVTVPYGEIVIFKKSIWYRTDKEDPYSQNQMVLLKDAKKVLSYKVEQMGSSEREEIETLRPLFDDLQRIQTEYDELVSKGFFTRHKEVWDESPKTVYSFLYSVKAKKTKLKFYMMKPDGIKGAINEYPFPLSEVPKKKVEIELDEDEEKKKLIEICVETLARSLFSSYVPAFTLNYELGDYFSFNHLLKLPSEGKSIVNPFWGIVLNGEKISKKEAFCFGITHQDIFKVEPKKLFVKKDIKKSSQYNNHGFKKMVPKKPSFHMSDELLADMFSE